MLPRLAFLSLFILHLSSTAQVQRKIRVYERKIQFSLFPGISTNGVYSASYYNKFSFNLFGGLSAGNHILELSPITNVNLKTSTGIQLAGLANIVGANAFVNLSVYEERELINKEDFKSTSQGIQAAGILNYVRDHATGIQASGVLNVVGDHFFGAQVAGLGNSAGGHAEGLQVAGFYNVGYKSISGIQISSLFNYTHGQLTGGQIGLINKARTIKGKKSTPPTRARGFQLGFINFSKSLHGLQIGVINFGGEMRGTQVALINFFNKMPTKEDVKGGTPIGLLNFGSFGSICRIYTNELFPINMEYTTGNSINFTWTQSGMPYDGRYQKFNQNALILGYNPFQENWGFGYGFEKVLYNKSSMNPKDKRNKIYELTYGLRFIHLNRDLSLDKVFNLVSRAHMEYGRRWRGHYLFAGASVNYFMREPENEDPYSINSSKIKTGKQLGLTTALWPGYSMGFQF